MIASVKAYTQWGASIKNTPVVLVFMARHATEMCTMMRDKERDLKKDLPWRRLAAMEHRGDPMTESITLDKLISWAKAQPINLKPKAGEAFGFGYADPRETPPEEWRCDLALTVPKDFKSSDEVIERHLPAGRYAVATHKGPYDTISDTIDHLYRHWLPESGEELGDLPCIFCYHNFDHDVAKTERLTEIWVLLQ
jgi:AraC family transcriptional regulator